MSKLGSCSRVEGEIAAASNRLDGKNADTGDVQTFLQEGDDP